MTLEADLVTGELSDWIEGLPPYQQDVVRDLVEASPSLEAAAEAWLNVTPGGDVAPYGVRETASLFFDKFQDELYKLLCDGASYEATRAELVKELRVGRTAAVAIASAAIAPALGAAAPLIAPAVAIILTAIGHVGLRAWCAMQDDRRAGTAL